MVSISVSIGEDIILENPILTASDIFGYGLEFDPSQDLNELGGFIVKGTTLHLRQGNSYPRTAKTTVGMLNCVGPQDRGVNYLVEHIFPRLGHYDTEIPVNVSGPVIDDYVACVERLSGHPEVRTIELGINCSNIKEGGMSFGVNYESAHEVVSAVRKAYKEHLMVKLLPNVAGIIAIARAAEEAGADSLSLISMLLGMAIDIEAHKPKLSVITGGPSSPVVKSIAIRMVWQMPQAVSILVTGLGGIASMEDAVELLLASATVVQAGTYDFVEPNVASKPVHGLSNYLEENHISDINELVGALLC